MKLLIGILLLYKLSPSDQVMVPTGNGEFQSVDDATINAAMQDVEYWKFNVSFLLFTRSNPFHPHTLIDGNASSVETSYFNSTEPTRVLCHGWRSSGASKMNLRIRNNYLARGQFNVIVMDWSSAADNLNYIKAAGSVKLAAKKLQIFIQFLGNFASLDMNTTYLIGHSLGAHVAGIASKNIQPRINTVFGLDPAAPLFANQNSSNRLANNDAQYVETIHTAGETFGIRYPIGNASFYPSFGQNQNGCEDTTTVCDHVRAWMYFAESLVLPNGFFAEGCTNFDALYYSFYCLPNGATAYMGGEPSNFVNHTRGIFYLPVNSQSPFAVGIFRNSPSSK